MSFPHTIHTTASTVEAHSDRADKRYVLGQKMEYEDGRMFRYVLVGAADLVAGDIVQGKAVVALDYDTVVVDAEAAIGATTVTVTGETTTAVNYYADGYMHTNQAATAAGNAQVYRVKSHVVFTTAAGKVITLHDWDPIRETLAASDEIGLTPCVYNGVIQAVVTTLTCMIVGVAVKDVTLAQYGWVQTRGICGVQADDDMLIGNYASAVLGAAGKVGAPDGYIDHNIGIAMSDVSADTEFAQVYLTLD